MADNAASVSVATVALSQTVSAYTFFLPSLREVRQASPNDSTMRGDVHLGIVGSALLGGTIAIMLSSLTGSQAPLWSVAITTVLIAFLYEIALRGERILE